MNTEKNFEWLEAIIKTVWVLCMAVGLFMISYQLVKYVNHERAQDEKIRHLEFRVAYLELLESRTHDLPYHDQKP